MIILHSYFQYRSFFFFYTDQTMNFIYSVLLFIILAVAVSCRFQVPDELSRRQYKFEVCEPRTANVEIKLFGCYVRRAPLQQCTGACSSTDSPHKGERKCTCCTPVKTKAVNVDVVCKVGNGKYGIVKHKVLEHEICSCLPCFD